MQPFTRRAFVLFYVLLALLAVFANSHDWWYDLSLFAAVYAIYWALICKYPQSRETIFLLIILPLPHLLGALGLYHLSIGNLTWDTFVHTATAFMGVLFMASFLSTKKLERWERAALIIVVLLLFGAAVEAVEWVGGRLAPGGEGLFFRGPGDYCAVRAPCTEAEDTAKDAVNNMIGMVLGIITILYHTKRRRSKEKLA